MRLMSRWIRMRRAYPAIRFPCVSASVHVARVFHARSRMCTVHTSPFLRIMGLVIAECPQLSEVEAGERSSVTGEHDGGLRVSEGADSLACVLVPGNVVHDVGDAVLVEFPFNGFTGHASGLSKQLCDGLVGVHGVAFWAQERPAAIREVTGLSGVFQAVSVPACRSMRCWMSAR